MFRSHIWIISLLMFCGPASVAQTPSGFEWSGDVRYRLNKGHESLDEDRMIQQLRVRLGLKAPVNEDVSAIIRMATATSAISGNQTLGDNKDPGMARRSFGLDLAYMDWKIMESGQFWAGRTANPFWSPGKVQTVFDADLAFEGLALRWLPKWSNSNFFLNAGGFIISENYAAPDDVVDSGLVGTELGYGRKSDSWSWTLHAGYFDFLNIQNKPITSFDKNATVDAYSYPFDRYKGNAVYPNDPLAAPASRIYYFQNKYRLVEIGFEWGQKFGRFEYQVFADRVQNTAIGNLNKGLEAGVTLKWSPIWISIAQIYKESDAVVAAFTDSDTNMGGTDNRGKRVQVGWSINKNAQAILTYFTGKRGVDTVERNFTSALADLSVAF